MGGRVSEIAERILEGDADDTSDYGVMKIGLEVQNMIEEYYQSLLKADLEKIDHLESLIEITVVFKNRIDFIYYPLLERLRSECALNHITLAQEHFASSHIINKLKGFLSHSVYSYNKKSCSIVIGTPSSYLYEGGVLSLACAMKIKGHNIYYLGSDLPISSCKEFALSVQPAVLAVSIRSPSDLDIVLKEYRNAPFPVCVGGLGTRLAENESLQDGSVYMIQAAGMNAVDRLDSICTEFYLQYQR